MIALEVTMVATGQSASMKPGDACIWGNAASAVLLIRLRDMGDEPRYRMLLIGPKTEPQRRAA